MIVQERAKHTKQKLLEAAMDLFHSGGVANTTLHNVAARAGVPLGNVYYHFKTKDDLVAEVIAARSTEIDLALAALDCFDDPKERLLAFISSDDAERQLLTAHGCPYAGLVTDLVKEGNRQSGSASVLLEKYVGFVEAQLVQMRLPATEARGLAEELIATLQGAYLLANAFDSQALFQRQLERLAAHIRAL